MLSVVDMATSTPNIAMGVAVMPTPMEDSSNGDVNTKTKRTDDDHHFRVD